MSPKESLKSLLGVVALSLGDPSQWVELKFNKIQANTVSYSAESIDIDVNKSASPLIHKFSESKSVKEVQVELDIEGKMQTQLDSAWGASFEEDSIFRLGLVAEGSKKLSGFSAAFAPKWVKTMFSLAPKGKGLDKIYFYNVTRFQKLLGKKRIHPSSQYMMEENVAFNPPEATSIQLSKKFAQPLATLGVWISVDGDESQSQFKVRIKKIKIITSK